MKKHLLTISIVTWNSADSIKECIQSLLRQTFTDYEIVIVDNNSLDETCRIIREFDDPRIKLIPLKENTGFCGGHNFIINQAESDYILLVNPDAVLNPEYLNNALSRISTDDSIGTVCGLLLQVDDEKNAIIDSAGMDFKRDGRFILRYHGEQLNKTNLYLTEVSGADGALPLYRKTMIEEIKINGKFFDEMFFAHKEDWDVSWRSNLLGWKTVFDPECIAVHPRSFRQGSLNSRKNMSAIIKYHAVKNQLLLIFKNEQNFLKSLFYLAPRQAAIFFYTLFFERKSFEAYLFIFKNRKEIFQARKLIQNKIKTLSGTR